MINYVSKFGKSVAPFVAAGIIAFGSIAGFSDRVAHASNQSYRTYQVENENLRFYLTQNNDTLKFKTPSISNTESESSDTRIKSNFEKFIDGYISDLNKNLSYLINAENIFKWRYDEYVENLNPKEKAQKDGLCELLSTLESESYLDLCLNKELEIYQDIENSGYRKITEYKKQIIALENIKTAIVDDLKPTNLSKFNTNLDLLQQTIKEIKNSDAFLPGNTDLIWEKNYIFDTFGIDGFYIDFDQAFKKIGVVNTVKIFNYMSNIEKLSDSETNTYNKRQQYLIHMMFKDHYAEKFSKLTYENEIGNIMTQILSDTNNKTDELPIYIELNIHEDIPESDSIKKEVMDFLIKSHNTAVDLGIEINQSLKVYITDGDRSYYKTGYSNSIVLGNKQILDLIELGNMQKLLNFPSINDRIISYGTVTAHEIFHHYQNIFGIYQNIDNSKPDWVSEGSADWFMNKVHNINDGIDSRFGVYNVGEDIFSYIEQEYDSKAIIDFLTEIGKQEKPGKNYTYDGARDSKIFEDENYHTFIRSLYYNDAIKNAFESVLGQDITDFFDEFTTKRADGTLFDVSDVNEKSE